jgi:hypothetical protein
MCCVVLLLLAVLDIYGLIHLHSLTHSLTYLLTRPPARAHSFILFQNDFIHCVPGSQHEFSQGDEKCKHPYGGIVVISHNGDPVPSEGKTTSYKLDIDKEYER